MEAIMLNTSVSILTEYRELLIRNQVLNKIKPPVIAEHLEVNKRLLQIELKLTSKEIIDNTKMAFQ